MLYLLYLVIKRSPVNVLQDFDTLCTTMDAHLLAADRERPAIRDTENEALQALGEGVDRMYANSKSLEIRMEARFDRLTGDLAASAAAAAAEAARAAVTEGLQAVLGTGVLGLPTGASAAAAGAASAGLQLFVPQQWRLQPPPGALAPPGARAPGHTALRQATAAAPPTHAPPVASEVEERTIAHHPSSLTNFDAVGVGMAGLWCACMMNLIFFTVITAPDPSTPSHGRNEYFHGVNGALPVRSLFSEENKKLKSRWLDSVRHPLFRPLARCPHYLRPD